jgi:dUTP pyrophosphatase
MSFWRLNSDRAIAPTRGTPGSAGWDLYAEEDVTIKHEDGNVLVKLTVSLAPGTMWKNAYARVAPRSGNAIKHVTVDAGVIDSDYVHNIGVVLRVVKPGAEVKFERGMRIAQLLFEVLYDVESAFAAGAAAYVPSSATQHTGFGSTGQ